MKEYKEIVKFNDVDLTLMVNFEIGGKISAWFIVNGRKFISKQINTHHDSTDMIVEYGMLNVYGRLYVFVDKGIVTLYFFSIKKHQNDKSFEVKFDVRK